MSDDPFQLEALPPERRRGRSMIVASGSCSCCCCCCLHSVGGLIGAAISSKSPPGVHTGLADRIYWLVFSTLVLLSFLYALGSEDELTVAAFGLALGLPAVQLVASLIAAGLLFASPARDKGACLKRIGLLSLFSFGGAFIGALAMVVLGFLLVGLSV